jgi:hypothetical protein
MVVWRHCREIVSAELYVALAKRWAFQVVGYFEFIKALRTSFSIFRECL